MTLTEAQAAEMRLRASQNAAEAREALKAQRAAEGISEADAAMFHALAERVLIDRLNRCSMGPANSKGRQPFILHGEPTEAEQHWNKLCAERKQTRVVKGGPLMGQEF